MSGPPGAHPPHAVAQTLTLKDPLVGTTVNGYEVTGRVGEGGMGLVYAAVQTDIGKRVAIKVMRPELAADPSFFTRLLTEARAVNAIRHRGIVDIFGSGLLSDGRQCLLMEYLEGESLETALLAAREQHRTLPIGDALIICDEVLNALGAAHQAAIVHRDLKPSNIFLCRQPNGERHVKLLDFGIAKVAAGVPTQASAIMGTPLYMAPEQAAADTVTPAIDLYAFGVILFEILTGRLPFEGDSVVRVMFHHVNTPPPVPSSLVPSVPAALDKLVAELLSKKPEARPALADVRKRLSRMRVALSDPSAVVTLDEPLTEFPKDALSTAEQRARALVPAPQGLGPGASTSLPRPSRTPVWVGLAMAVVVALGLAVVATRPDAAPGPLMIATPAPAAPEVRPQVPTVIAGPTPAPSAVAAPTPPEPVVIATPTPAPVPSVVTAGPTAVPASTSAVPARKIPRSLAARLHRLEQLVGAQKRAGEDVDLAERQLGALQAELAKATQPEQKEAIEVALTRLEQELTP